MPVVVSVIVASWEEGFRYEGSNTEKCIIHVIFLNPRHGIELTRIQLDWRAACHTPVGYQIGRRSGEQGPVRVIRVH